MQWLSTVSDPQQTFVILYYGLWRTSFNYQHAPIKIISFLASGPETASIAYDFNAVSLYSFILNNKSSETTS